MAAFKGVMKSATCSRPSTRLHFSTCRRRPLHFSTWSTVDARRSWLTLSTSIFTALFITPAFSLSFIRNERPGDYLIEVFPNGKRIILGKSADNKEYIFELLPRVSIFFLMLVLLSLPFNQTWIER